MCSLKHLFFLFFLLTRIDAFTAYTFYHRILNDDKLKKLLSLSNQRKTIFLHINSKFYVLILSEKKTIYIL